MMDNRDDVAAKNRFENFKLGKGLPSSAPLGGPVAGPKHGHARSHSRNKSISNSISSFSFPAAPRPTSVHDMSHFSFPPSNPAGATAAAVQQASAPTTPTLPSAANPVPSTKRNSHHRRRSSVLSTRRESAELMGVSLPDLPPSMSEDNINLGEKDSIRRRALWALEGKPDVSFSKVEIPDISTPDIEKMMFDFSTAKPSLNANSNSTYGNPFSGSKRDSFKLLGPSSSSKDQLHTLLEEEEEEEEECAESSMVEDSLPSPVNSIKENVPPPNTPITPTPAVAVTKPTPSKPRPANLNLRPLSLTPENLNSTIQGLPTPTLTPSPRAGLRSLSLSPSPVPSLDDSAPSSGDSIKQSRRSSLIMSPTPASRRPQLNLSMEKLENNQNLPPSTDDEPTKASRRSSISYKRSSTGSRGSVTVNVAGLPTPEMTPTSFGRRYSNAELLPLSLLSNANFGVGGGGGSSASVADGDEFFPGNPPTQSRPLSTSEQHFLFKSHNALLARITDLERALSMRRRESGGGYSNGGSCSSRPMSVASNFSSSSSAGVGGASEYEEGNGEMSDEMLRLIADLKAERDELKRDVDGWRTRVSNLENQTGVLAKRVENERRDAWVARSRVGLLEVEKGVLAKKLEAVDELLELHEQEKGLWVSEKAAMRRETEEYKRRVGTLEEELEVVKKELEVERARAKKAEQEIDPLATPKPRSFDHYSRTVGAPPVGKKHGLGFMSVDSESSATDVEPDSSDDGQHAFGFALKAVQEESDEVDEDYYSEEDDNGLAGYEDEEDTDISLMDETSSSFGSEEELNRATGHLQQQGARASSPTTPTRQVFTPPKPTHVSRATLSRTWTFPKGPAPLQISAPAAIGTESVDRFFECLGDVDSDTSGSVPSSPSAYSYEKSKGLFSSGFKFAPEDDNASFFLPAGVGMPADDEPEQDERRLSIVAEEEEEEEYEEESTVVSDAEDEDMFGDIGGIRIIFTPPQEDEVKEERKQIQVSPVKRTSPPPMLPALDFGGFDEEDDQEDEERIVIPFNFGRALTEGSAPTPITPPSSIPRPTSHSVVPASSPRPASPSVRPASPSMIPRPASPSSIPRPTSTKPSVTVMSDSPKFSPMRAIPASSILPPASFITPPTKRGGVVPSFIPQPVSSSPSPMRTLPTLSKPKVVPSSTFIRQPTRKPLLLASKASGSTNVPSNAAMNIRPFRRSSDERDGAAIPAATFFDRLAVVGDNNNNARSSSQMKSIDLSHDQHTQLRSQHTTTSQPSSSAIGSSNPSSVSTSIMSSPLASRLSFQTFTNFIPWGARSAPVVPESPSVIHSAASSASDDTVVASVKAGKRGYISRGKQLQKLKTRMEVEGLVAMKSRVHVQCKKCDGELVFI